MAHENRAVHAYPNVRVILAQDGIEHLFGDPDFTGKLLARLCRSGMSEEDMDTIFMQAEDDIIGAADVLTGIGSLSASRKALAGFVSRLKHQILADPDLYINGT